MTNDYFANSFSIMAIISDEFGWTLLLNRATTSPCLLTKNFSKFQATVGAAVSLWHEFYRIVQR
jgi:hypothetical protein